jgi:hypothetical protein
VTERTELTTEVSVSAYQCLKSGRKTDGLTYHAFTVALERKLPNNSITAEHQKSHEKRQNLIEQKETKENQPIHTIFWLPEKT